MLALRLLSAYTETMSFLLQATQPFVDVEQLNQAGLTGVVVPIPTADLQSGQLNGSLSELRPAGLNLYCQVDRDMLDQVTAQEAWDQLAHVQSLLHTAQFTLPLHRQSLELVHRAAGYSWTWHIAGIRSVADAALALAAGARGLWIEVGTLDDSHEFGGDELCSQVRSFIDARFAHTPPPQLVGTDLRDTDHIERTLSYGCDLVVLTETLWSGLLE